MAKRCKAKSKQSGVQCKKWAVPGFDVCHIHGGKTPVGIAATTLKNGRYSKHLPARLAEKYEASLKDPALLELKNEIALTDARLEDLLKRVDTGESGGLWLAVQSAWREFKSGTPAEKVKATVLLDRLIDDALEDYMAWSEIQTVLEQRRKLVESERKRLVEMQQYITSNQAMTLVAAMIGIIKDNVRDRDTLQNISTAVNGLVAANVS